MKYLKAIVSIVLMMSLGLTQSWTQDAIPAAGGDATGSGGSASYSVGQVFYTAHPGTNGSVIRGVQQPYEISVISGIEEAGDIDLNFRIYPNPASDVLMLTVEHYNNDNLWYQLIDNNGKVIADERITGNSSSFPMRQYASGTYYLNVIVNDKSIKTFKITKN